MPDQNPKKPSGKAVKRKRGNRLETWEIAVVKAMQARGGYADQDIQSYFTRPMRTVNHRAFSEIRTGDKHKSIKAATKEDLDAFLEAWPNIDPDTGLNLQGDEILIKAREAMIAAVHIFNSAGLTFRAELFIVTSVIAWTYLLHAWFKREGIDFQYEKKTKEEIDRYWDLAQCLKDSRCPIPSGVKTNLKFLLGIRNEIVHQSTNPIDEAIGGELQACCINFNNALKEFFGRQYGLEKRLPIALQFVSFSEDQRTRLKRVADLPAHVSTFISAFENQLTDEQLKDPAFRYRVAFVPMANNRAAGADLAIEFVKHGSEAAEAFNRVIFKEINRKRYIPSRVVEEVNKAGYGKFRMQDHTVLWQTLNAKNPDKGYGCAGDYKGNWVWFESWVKHVLKYCAENGEKFKSS